MILTFRLVLHRQKLEAKSIRHAFNSEPDVFVYLSNTDISMWCRGFVFTILIVNAKLNHVYHCELTIIDKLHYSFDGNLVGWSPLLNYWSFVTPCGFNSPWIYEGKAPEIESTGRVKTRLEALEKKKKEDKLQYAVNYRTST